MVASIHISYEKKNQMVIKDLMNKLILGGRNVISMQLSNCK